MEWLSVSEVGKLANIPPETVRRYITRHSLHLQVKKGYKSYQIAESCVSVFIQIRTLYTEGKQSDEVETALARSGRPTIVTVNESGDAVTVNMVEALAALDSKMNVIIGMFVNVDERLKAGEKNRDDVNEDMKAIREQVMNVHAEVAATTEQFQEIQKGNAEILSRLEIHSKRKKFLGLF